MQDSLSNDEFDALEQIRKGIKGDRPSACVARNSKRLNGLKYITHEKSGRMALTDKGKQVLFVKSCIDGLRAVADDPFAKLGADVAVFLGKKGHIVAREADGGFEVSEKGRESLADIDSGSK